MAKIMREYEVTIAFPRVHEYMGEEKILQVLNAILKGTEIEAMEADLVVDKVIYDD